MKISVIELVGFATSFAFLGFMIATSLWYHDESVIVDRIVPIEKIVTQNITEYVDRVVIKEVPYTLSSNTTISLDIALAIIADGKASHLNMVAHPEYQTAYSGDTSFNQGWVTFYTGLEDFIKWQTNRIKELEK